MTGLGDEDSEEDLRASRIVARMRLIMIGSMAVMFLGILVVMAVIVYRTMGIQPGAAGIGPQAPVSSQTPLPPGSRVVGTAADGERLYVTVETPDGAQAIDVFDAASLTYRGRIALVPAR